MTILILGRGGREHAIAKALAQSPSAGRLVAAPGNPGIAEVAELRAVDILSPDAVVALAREENADLVVIGPEAPLEAGVSDALRAAGIACFGPSRQAARLETSKSFAKQVLAEAGAPTARAASFDTAEAALAHLADVGAPIVVKADGLAAGKGVIVAETADAAQAAIGEIFDGRFGSAGARVLLEEKLDGPELSVFALTDGRTARLIGSAQDHKRAFDGDAGPNTGGMGAYAPAPVATEALEESVLTQIVNPVLRVMRQRGAPYQGVLFAGLMLTAEGPKVIEFNARFGDPEAQVVLPRLRSDLAALMRACAAGPEGGLDRAQIDLRADALLCVTVAAKGYPGSYAKGEPIKGVDAAAQAPGASIIHAGTRLDGAQLVSDGGRVLSVIGRADTLSQARDRAYEAVDALDWPGGFCRRDIGWRALG